MLDVNKLLRLVTVTLFGLSVTCFSSRLNAQTKINHNLNIGEKKDMQVKKVKTDAEWKKELTLEQYQILREKGTEKPFSGKYWNYTKDGIYKCAACGAIIFDSETKFDAGCGWPSFNDVINSDRIIAKDDPSLGMNRIEVMCANCGGHLGHVFDDGPKPTGLRYCINSVAIEFDNREENPGKKKD
jgi:peptide-methionine (R)-S-oxide reductase